jgi:hypothetical protein
MRFNRTIGVLPINSMALFAIFMNTSMLKKNHGQLKLKVAFAFAGTWFSPLGVKLCGDAFRHLLVDRGLFFQQAVVRSIPAGDTCKSKSYFSQSSYSD